jgi:prophage regulatory protein
LFHNEGKVMSLEHSPGRGRRLLSAKQVMARMGWSRTTLWRRVRDGLFPAPVKTGAISAAFYEDEVDAAQEKLPRVTWAPQSEAAQ